MNALTPDDLQVITAAAQSYFSRLTRKAATVSAAYPGERSALPEFDYTGLIQVSGSHRGCVYFTAPKLMMRYLLLSAGETLQGDDIYMGAAGEIANTIAGNARKHFGEKMEISVPATLKGAALESLSKSGVLQILRQQPMVISIQWQALAAALVVDLESAAA
ncbi:MAG: chemotaxis protein CheX [Betaproteobacteria bacterium]|nr:chemotaxis protein CheX [Betaproteobacteria bacterium]